MYFTTVSLYFAMHGQIHSIELGITIERTIPFLSREGGYSLAPCEWLTIEPKCALKLVRTCLQSEKNISLDDRKGKEEDRK